MGRKQKVRRQRRGKIAPVKNDSAKNKSSSSSSTPATAPSKDQLQAKAREFKQYRHPADEDFSESKCFKRGQRLWNASIDRVVNKKLSDENEMVSAIETLLQGAESGCVPSMYCYSNLMMTQFVNSDHCALSWLLEGAIRGSIGCASNLVDVLYAKAKPAPPFALTNYWRDRINETSGDAEAKASARAFKEELGLRCHVCGEVDSEAVTLEKCACCKVYFYCGKDCQHEHWKGQGRCSGHCHMGECKQLRILKKYHKPHADKIREAVIRGDRDIPELQKLRSKLGLTIPVEEYRDLLEEINEGCNGGMTTKENCEYLVSRKDGTVHFGSTPNPI